MNLYEVTGNILALQDLLEVATDEEIEEALKDTLELTQGEYEYKLEAYCKVIKNLESDVEKFKAEAKRLTDKAKVIKNNVDRLKKTMYDSMKATKTDKVKGQIFTIAIQKNGGKLPIVLDVPVEDLPDQFVRVVESPDLEAIAEALDNGECAVAHYGERGDSLRIK